MKKFIIFALIVLFFSQEVNAGIFFLPKGRIIQRIRDREVLKVRIQNRNKLFGC